MSALHLHLPPHFSFPLTLQFLQRSPRELLHRVNGGRVVKWIDTGTKKFLIEIHEAGKQLVITFLDGQPTGEERIFVQNYVMDWFDMHTDLLPFYQMAEHDKLLQPLVEKYRGYRIVGQPDLFESMVWAVLGQQINLSFAYTLKEKFVELLGARLSHQGVVYYIFPHPEVVMQVSMEQLLAIQFSRQKAAYTRNIAEAFASGCLSKRMLDGLPLAEAKQVLMGIKGIGNWTANYALMKTFRYPDAFPLEDAGLHNAIKNLRSMKEKPTLEQVKRIFKRYKGWEAYATLYLWRSLVSE
jgi:DNA-3-methyladenine glycosylase II